MTKEDFLKDVANWDNHRYLLWPALQVTEGPVVEFGIGHGSTPFLHEYCSDRKLYSYENNLEWLDQFKHLKSENHKLFFVKDWDDVELDQVDVLLIDHSPGSRRKEDLAKYANIAKIIVLHDSEIPGWNASDYQVRPVFSKFKYTKDLQPEYHGGAWASILSNFIDVTKFEI